MAARTWGLPRLLPRLCCDVPATAQAMHGSTWCVRRRRRRVSSSGRGGAERQNGDFFGAAMTPRRLVVSARPGGQPGTHAFRGEGGAGGRMWRSCGTRSAPPASPAGPQPAGAAAPARRHQHRRQGLHRLQLRRTPALRACFRPQRERAGLRMSSMAEAMVASKSRARCRSRLSHARVRSPAQRRRWTAEPLWSLGFLTISTAMRVASATPRAA